MIFLALIIIATALILWYQKIHLPKKIKTLPWYPDYELMVNTINETTDYSGLVTNLKNTQEYIKKSRGYSACNHYRSHLVKPSNLVYNKVSVYSPKAGSRA